MLLAARYFLILFLFASSAFAGMSCDSAIDNSVQNLIELGYAPPVAKHLASERPEVVQRIFRDPKFGSPFIVYRGIETVPENYESAADPKKFGYMKGIKYGSPNLSTAFMYASSQLRMWKRNGTLREDLKEFGIVLELQAPFFFYGEKYDLKRWKASTLDYVATRVRNMPDDKPFILRVGIIHTDLVAIPKNIEWISAKEFFKRYQNP